MNTPQNIPSHDAITSRARKIWESSGQIDGQDLSNWLQAERELLDEAAASSRNGDSVVKKADDNSKPGSPSNSESGRPWPRDRGNQHQSSNERGKARSRQ